MAGWKAALASLGAAGRSRPGDAGGGTNGFEGAGRLGLGGASASGRDDAMVKDASTCALCGLTTYHPLFDEAGQVYCCPACREVGGLLAEREQQPATAITPEQSETTSTTLHLGGLWCPSCAWLIGESLSRADGVVEADVNFLQRQAQVRYAPDRIDPRRLVRQVRRLGYRAWLPGEQPYDEEEAHWNRLLAGGVLVMNVMMFSFALYIRQWAGRASPDTEWLAHIFQIFSLAAAIPVMILLGLPILRAGAASLLRGRPNLHTLIALGSFSAFTLSLRNLLMGSGHVYFDTAAVLLFLVAVGRWLEMQAQKHSTAVVERLYERLPGEAALITPEGEQRLPIEQVRPGMRLRVRPGERFPVDGVIATGSGYVDESLLTGEPEAVVRGEGDRILAGTINLDGSFQILATAVAEQTVAGQIGRMLHQALWQRSSIERLADRLAAFMTPLATLLALTAFLYWTWQVDIDQGLTIALSVLLIACPCALGIATPLTLWLGLGRAAEQGILLRSTGVLERLATISTFFFDKTGTLTRRPLQLHNVYVSGGDAGTVVASIAAVESLSEHPLAQAIVQGLQERYPGLSPSNGVESSSFRALPGLGVVAGLAGRDIWVGSRRLMEQQNLAFTADMERTLAAWQAQGLTVVYAGWDGRVQGMLALAEQARADAAPTLALLREQGYRVAVLTGDDRAAGRRWQERLQVPVFAEQSPEDKLARISSAKDVVMVGDGINDGPALAAADVGVALVHGTDVAQAAADVVLLNDNLRSLPWLLSLARVATRKVRENLAWAFAYNLVGLSLAVAGRLHPDIAALLMVASSLIVTGNALRLKKAALPSLRPQDQNSDDARNQAAAPVSPVLSSEHG
ncbi:MAG: cation-translocating P-type ATPase [Caldilineae bacterium]|nr:MAG: cation-translocating P-type ATPase [Caldilineae bacterium]